MADDRHGPTPAFRYALPYYTRDQSDTEYLISNPGAAVVTGWLDVYDKKCQAKRLDVKIDPNCTMSVRLSAVVADNAGHAILGVSDVVIANLLYFWTPRSAIMAGELAGASQLLQRSDSATARTYGLGYRTLPLDRERLTGAVFVSNPTASLLTGDIVFYHEKCDVADRQDVKVDPGCTKEHKIPSDRYGFARLRLSDQAVINVLHFRERTPTIAVAELVGESNRVQDVPVVSRDRRRILFDVTHDGAPSWPGAGGRQWTAYQAALTTAGYVVTELMNPPVTAAALQGHDVYVVAAARMPYSAAELTAIVDFANRGGGVLVVQEFAAPGVPTPWTLVMRDILLRFAAVDDANTVIDALHNTGGTDDVLYSAGRNFRPHPIVAGINNVSVDASCSFAFNAPWTTVIETDGDAVPPRRPILMSRSFGAGRILVYGCSDTWGSLLGNHDNKAFGIRCMEWLLFRI